MKPKSTEESQGRLFQTRLDQILDMEHSLILLANDFDWSTFDKNFGEKYDQGFGRPGLPTRLMVGLQYLKYAFNLSDEGLAERFVENPYYQYFCGFEYFQHKCPFDPSSMSRWRKRMGEEGGEELLKQTILTGIKNGSIKKSDLKKVNVDTTVQEKNITFPTDAKLYHRARQKLVKAAKDRGIPLRQSYRRVSKRSLRKHWRLKKRNPKEARAHLRKLKTYLGRVIRDIERKAKEPDQELLQLLEISQRIFDQQRNDKNKVYSVHEPHVECIAKGKAHKKYEFGNKASVVTTMKSNWAVGAMAFHGNPYDGHTLKEALDNSEELTGVKAEEVFCDRGYRNTKVRRIKDTKVFIAGRQRKHLTASEKRNLKRRSAIEPVIGHFKSDNRLSRNQLAGVEGDKINVKLSAAGYNMRKLLKKLKVELQQALMIQWQTLLFLIRLRKVA